MPIQTFNPMGELVQGLLNAHSIANQIKRAALEREHFEQQKIDGQRRREYEDFIRQNQIRQAARPSAVAGKIRDSVRMDAIPGFVGEEKVAVERDIDPSRKYTYTDARGQQSDYELMTPEEQAQRLLQQKVSEAQLMSGLKISGQIEALRHGVGEDARAEADRKGREATAAAERENRRAIAEGGWRAASDRGAQDRQSREKVAKDRNAATVEAARIRGARQGQMTEGQAAEQERATFTQKRQAEAEVRKLDADIETLHSHARMLGTASKAKAGEKVLIPTKESSKSVELTEDIKGQLADQAREIKQRLAELTADRDRKATALGWGASKRGGSGGGAASGGGAGATFDWVPGKGLVRR